MDASFVCRVDDAGGGRLRIDWVILLFARRWTAACTGGFSSSDGVGCDACFTLWGAVSWVVAETVEQPFRRRLFLFDFINVGAVFQFNLELSSLKEVEALILFIYCLATSLWANEGFELRGCFELRGTGRRAGRLRVPRATLGYKSQPLELDARPPSCGFCSGVGNVTQLIRAAGFSHRRVPSGTRFGGLDRRDGSNKTV